VPLFRLVLPLTLALALAGCTQFPELDSRTADIDPRAPYPALVPLEPLLAQARDTRIDDESEARVAARVAALNARAERLRRTIIDSDTRDRLDRGVTR
jgi:hypothetical protein